MEIFDLCGAFDALVYSERYHILPTAQHRACQATPSPAGSARNGARGPPDKDNSKAEG